MVVIKKFDSTPDGAREHFWSFFALFASFHIRINPDHARILALIILHLYMKKNVGTGGGGNLGERRFDPITRGRLGLAVQRLDLSAIAAWLNTAIYLSIKLNKEFSQRKISI